MKMDDVYDDLAKGVNKASLLNRLFSRNKNIQKGAEAPTHDSNVMEDFMQITEGGEAYKTRDVITDCAFNKETPVAEVYPTQEMRVKRNGEYKELRADFLQELAEAADRNGHIFIAKKGKYEIHKDSNKIIDVDQKGAMKFYDGDVGGDMIQDYLAIAARHKFAHTNKTINIKLNTDVIKSQASGEKFFSKCINTLVDNGVEPHRLRIQNPEYQYVLDNYLKTLEKHEPPINNTPKYEVSEGEVVEAKKTENKADEDNHRKIEGSFRMAAMFFNDKTTKAEMENSFKNGNINVEFLNGGEYTKISVIDKSALANSGSDVTETVLKTSDLENEKEKKINIQAIKKAFLGEEPQKEVIETPQAPQAQEVKGVADEPEKPSNDVAASEVKKEVAANDEAVAEKEVVKEELPAKEDGLKSKVESLMAESKGNLFDFDALSQKENLNVEFSENHKTMMIHEKDKPDAVTSIDLTASGQGRAFMQELKINDEITFRNAADEVTKNGQLQIVTQTKGGLKP